MSGGSDGVDGRVVVDFSALEQVGVTALLELVGVMVLLELKDGTDGVRSSRGGNNTGRSCCPVKLENLLHAYW